MGNPGGDEVQLKGQLVGGNVDAHEAGDGDVNVHAGVQQGGGGVARLLPAVG